jgi:penicillin amidase
MRRAIGFVLLVVILLVAGAFAWWEFAIHHALPQVDGTISLPELKAEVQVTRDVRGVPHIRAQSTDDLYFAQGYVMAQDRLWQMDILRRAAAGELSEILGPSTIEIDRRFRMLGLRQAAERDAGQAGVEFRGPAEAFARGVNRFIEDHSGSLPIEFRLLRYQPKPWRVADTLLIVGYMYESLTSTWRWDLNRAAVSKRLGTQRAADFYDDTSPYDHPIVGVAGQPGTAQASADAGPVERRVFAAKDTRQQVEYEQTASEAFSSIVPPSSILRPGDPSGVTGDAQNILFAFDENIRAALGSNNWVVDGTHTASGKPLLENDTHLMLGVPDIWYLVQLNGAGMNAEGFALPGAPGIIIGHNDRIAWGFTNDYADVQDLYAETFNPADPQQYQVNGQWVATQVRHEVIHVKGQADRTMDVVVTRHGAVVEQDGNTGYALKWTATQPGGLSHAYFGLAAAHNWQEFRERMRDAAGPAQNAVYADVDGHIGFIVAAHIPMRRCANWPPAGSNLPLTTPCGSVPMPGNTDDYEWTGYIPFDDLPQVLDPPGGIIATANARVVGAGYPHFITSNWGPPWRTDRIYKLLAAPTKFRPEDFAEIERDVYSEIDVIVAQALVKAGENAKPHDSRTSDLIGRLATWSGRMDADSVEATFVEQAVSDIERNILHPYLDDNVHVSNPRLDVFLERALRERPAMWLPPGFHNYDELLMASADLAVSELTASIGNDTSKWKWGQRNSLLIAHPFGQSGLLARIFSIGPMPQSGAHDVIKAAGHSFGPAMRMVADLSNWDASFMEITTGESGELGSQHYRDQFPAWFSGQPLPAPYSEEAVRPTIIHTLLLEPGKR